MVEPSPWGARAEVATALILSAAGLLSAWAAFQANLWAGVQVTAFAEANVRHTEAARIDAAERLTSEKHRALVNNWLEAAAGGDARRMAFYENHLTDDQGRAFDAWREKLPTDIAAYERPDGAPPLPLPDVLEPSDEAMRRVQGEAAARFADGQAASSIGGRYVFATVLLSLVLFLAGISQTLTHTRLRIALLGLSALIFAGAALFVVGLPHAAL